MDIIRREKTPFFIRNNFQYELDFQGQEELKDTQDFSKLIIEGKIKAYRGEDFIVEMAEGKQKRLNHWFLEKDSLFGKVSTAD